MDIVSTIAQELNISNAQVNAAINLLDAGDTVPFISRYRKEVTGALTDTQLRNLAERLIYLRELDARRATILASIKSQDKLTPELEKNILAAESKTLLEDYYAPFKPKRRTKAQIAREAGLEKLSMQLLQDPTLTPEVIAQEFINPENSIHSVAEALEGARHILMETFAENAKLTQHFRHYLWENGILKTEVIKDKEVEGNKFSDYFSYQEAIKKIPSHRALAVFRGQQLGILGVALTLETEETENCKAQIAKEFNVGDHQRAADAWLLETVNWTWRIKLASKLELELLTQLREQAEEEAINVFANNLKHLLLAAPAGSHVTLGLDPGFRTGVKAVVIDGTGKLLHYETIFPHAPRNDKQGSLKALHAMCEKFQVSLVSIGNGTASRETDRLVLEFIKLYPKFKLKNIVVSEAGASVYSASEYAAIEFPDLDVTYRGAVSIARRLQDPLAELVKIEPKAIGVGQYQHDVNQLKLSRSLHAVMEDCVNAVGVDVNTASAPLLSCVAGLNTTIATNIINFRNENGAFKKRSQLQKVARLGAKAFEQSAGFLKIMGGDDPLDASAVHPEAYAIVEKILATQNKSIRELMGNTAVLRTLRPEDYADENFGVLTVADIFVELEKPGRDPRPEFKTATFSEGIEKISDLTVGLIVEGVVTNVANFGAFVDIGVHQDGLVHKSLLANHFVKDPHEIIKVGDIVKVKVLEVDLVRKRIQLSMRLTEVAAEKSTRVPERMVSKTKAPSKDVINSAFGDALRDAFK